MTQQKPQQIKAARGSTLRCKGWKQETILRMLENNLENAEDASRLTVYGGIGKAARNWESYDAIVESLKMLENDETLAIQSGMPVAIFKTHRLAPRVVMANSNVIKADWPKFYDLSAQNLTAFASYTAGPWQYIGSQGVIEGTFETLALVADRHFGGELKGRVFFTAGLGGMGRSQPLAMTMHGGVSVTVEVRQKSIDERLANGYADIQAASLEEAIGMADSAQKEGRALSIVVLGNMVEALEQALNYGWKPDIVTEMCPCHDPFALIPAGLSLAEAAELLERDRDAYMAKSRESMKRIVKAMNRFKNEGAVVFEYGTFVRKEAVDAGMSREEAFAYPGCIAEYVRPLFFLGRGPFRWTCVSGEVSDQRRLDDLALKMFKDDPLVTRWISRCRDRLPVEGLPARICFLGFGQRRDFGLAVNALVRSGELKGPVAFSRDNLDTGSIANPAFETENMLDGSDAISDWPYLNALLNVSAMADLVAIQSNGTMGISAHTGVTMIADGSEEADLRLDACLTTDAGIGVVRHAQAGYPMAKLVAQGLGPLTDQEIQVPLWWSPQATLHRP
ncbi:urocanate hydratase [Pseudomonas fluorescens]|uniref:Urocanate hydratase n=1 Tax=Pseudomonas fluorescens TaxID=294 RepID=A0A5E7HGF8_PSEFL|nr:MULTISPECIES: urocanate hydratase [Pseudomonas]KOP57757.1 urocanate hydratase [Pseudomonas coronafaciens pv. porri]KPY22431.1 Urocanate hydratase [Pseudomonas coronafaciens pv. porri]OPA95537.1 urocanate hydratase [Pseudomonas fluorescens]OPB12862.1 urocanate hydratase [Pseudomonas fluorescens]OPB25262.1 urocanate hydratase [Pseudomonas fluorescens]